ncbi:MAG: FkbM family methyltransferase [Pseudomonadota bacterium]|mgnify:FL=1|nr:FkbM family methyltransferase [Alphaproteobacteria bacterium]MEC7701328.1 FkbM family methyltransferase [Pseudomonadota bacterium]MEC9236611.1 FkbM family methyltransferase [Pseudomonadota bacterium]MED5423374.1 FkbM family methyltransferase [Pseudomonadota bacterium]MEE3323628.1 FkbM family methyltransferase [Pseudomonadota bacterium]
MTDDPLYELVDTVHGRMLVNPRDVYIGAALKEYGEAMFTEWTFLKQLIRRGDNVMDVGANIGVHTLAFAKEIGPEGAVWAFEMQNAVFQNLCANMALNDLENVFAYQVAVGSETGAMHVNNLNMRKRNNFGGISIDKIKNETAMQKIFMHKLDDICGHAQIRLIKIDVEGMELDALKGAENIIQTSRPYLYVENDRKDKEKDLVQYILDMDYRVWIHWPYLFNPNNARGIKENSIGNFISKNIFCQPKEMAKPVGGLEEITDVQQLDEYPKTA